MDEVGEAGAWLDAAAAARGRVRRARRSAWVPMALLGVLVLGSVPLYAATWAGPDVLSRQVSDGAVRVGAVGVAPLAASIRLPAQPRYFPTGPFVADPTALALYWLVGTVLTLALSVLLVRWRGARLGALGRVAGYVVAGAGVLLVLVLTAVMLGPGVGTTDFTVRAMVPLFAVAAAVLALAWLERDRVLGGFGLLVTALALVANLYDMQNLASRMGIGGAGPAFNVEVVGAVLVLGAVGFALAGRRAGDRVRLSGSPSPSAGDPAGPAEPA